MVVRRVNVVEGLKGDGLDLMLKDGLGGGSLGRSEFLVGVMLVKSGKRLSVFFLLLVDVWFFIVIKIYFIFGFFKCCFNVIFRFLNFWDIGFIIFKVVFKFCF